MASVNLVGNSLRQLDSWAWAGREEQGSPGPDSGETGRLNSAAPGLGLQTPHLGGPDRAPNLPCDLGRGPGTLLLKQTSRIL